jgi:hypothetical protein
MYQSVKSSICINQLHMKDSPGYKDTFLYKLSLDTSLSHFQRVLMFASKQDLYTPFESAMVLPSKLESPNANIYNEMQVNLSKHLSENRQNCEIIYPWMDPSWGWNDVLGRNAHIAMLDDDAFLEMAVHLCDWVPQ